MTRSQWEFTDAPNGEHTGVKRLLSLTEEAGVDLFVNPDPVEVCREKANAWLRRLPETRDLPEVDRILECRTHAEIMMALEAVSRVTERSHALAVVV